MYNEKASILLNLELGLPVVVFDLSLHNSFIEKEEEGRPVCFDEEYRAYMTRTPRWIGLPKS